ncbi:MAG: virulence factor Mce, partial [Marmoricola sp.]
GFIFHINLKTIPSQPRAYTAADRPVNGANNAPNCAGLPNPPIPYYPSRNLPDLNDGVNDKSLNKNGNGRVAPRFAQQGSGLSAGVSGTAAQKGVINALIGPALGITADQMPDLGALLYSPAMADTEVSVR